MLGPFATASRLTLIQQGSLAVLSRAACALMSTTSTTTTTTRDRGDRYGPMEWAQQRVGCMKHSISTHQYMHVIKENRKVNICKINKQLLLYTHY